MITDNRHDGRSHTLARNTIAHLTWVALCILTAVAATAAVGFVAPYAAMYALIAFGGTTLLWLRD